MMTDPTDNNGYELSVTRHINAPPERVWEMMTRRIEERPICRRTVSGDYL
jgi:hypothetical protein